MAAIVYFSRPFQNSIDGKKDFLQVGNTKIVAQKIAGILDVEVLELIPKIAYSKSYQAVFTQADKKKEQRDDQNINHFHLTWKNTQRFI